MRIDPEKGALEGGIRTLLSPAQCTKSAASFFLRGLAVAATSGKPQPSRSHSNQRISQLGPSFRRACFRIGSPLPASFNRGVRPRERFPFSASAQSRARVRWNFPSNSGSFRQSRRVRPPDWRKHLWLHGFRSAPGPANATLICAGASAGGNLPVPWSTPAVHRPGGCTTATRF